MKDFEKIESLLQTKAYELLSVEERQLVDQELGRDVYEELRTGMHHLQGEKIAVNRGVKQSLMSAFRQQEKKGLATLFHRKVPAYSLLVPTLLVVVLFWFLPAKEVPVIQDRLVEVTVRDTVEVVRTDTLWREKIVKVPQLVYVAKEAEEAEVPVVVSRSLSDQKEVLDLVVRGK